MTDTPRDQRTVVPASFRIYSDDRETYRQIKEETGLPTDAQVFSQLVHAFYDPVHIQDDRQQLQQQLDQATDALQHLQADYQQLQSDNQQLRDQAAAADLRINELQQLLTGAQNKAAEEANRLQLEYEQRQQQLESSHRLQPSQHILSIPDPYWKALQLVAQRESRRRSQPWTPSHVVSFFIHSRFILGNLNGDLRSIPDAELRAAGIPLSPAAPSPIQAPASNATTENKPQNTIDL